MAEDHDEWDIPAKTFGTIKGKFMKDPNIEANIQKKIHDLGIQSESFKGKMNIVDFQIAILNEMENAFEESGVKYNYQVIMLQGLLNELQQLPGDE
jgi:hypothetical protein